jgi:hypothetical protein
MDSLLLLLTLLDLIIPKSCHHGPTITQIEVLSIDKKVLFTGDPSDHRPNQIR